MSSIKDRQRAAARARLEKEMAERAATARRRRQRQAAVGAGLALLLIVGGTVWLVTAMGDDSDGTPPGAAAPPPGMTSCFWNTDGGPPSPQIKDVGVPPTNVPNVGARVMTINTNLGPIEAQLDLAKVPCTAASFTHLGSKKFFDNSKCHRLVKVNDANNKFNVLQCGDPSATGKGYRETDGTGGPTYRFAEENLPVSEQPPYPEGVIAMANTGQPNTSGSQFFIVFDDTNLDPAYTVLGKITKGMEIVKQVGAAGHDNAFAQQAGGGHPKKELVLETLRVA